MMAYYEQFFQNDPPLSILIYSGDIDIATVPHAKTQVCLDGLGRSVTQSWSRWTIPGPALPHRANNITAGYVEVFDGYTFATVKGAGHEVPTYQPIFAYNMFERFVLQKQRNLGGPK
jgi:serine carboxypeptidase-like clade II